MLWFPTQLCLRFAGIPDQKVHFGRTEIFWVYKNYFFSQSRKITGSYMFLKNRPVNTLYNTYFSHPFSFKLKAYSDMTKGHADKIADLGGLTRCNNEVFGLFL